MIHYSVIPLSTRSFVFMAISIFPVSGLGTTVRCFSFRKLFKLPGNLICRFGADQVFQSAGILCGNGSFDTKEVMKKPFE
jgi:hypothetical protein